MVKVEINNMNDGNMIIDDVTVRTLLVRGSSEVERIRHINQDRSIFKVTPVTRDIYKIELIYKVGDYYEGR